VFLINHVSKRLGPVLARDDLIHAEGMPGPGWSAAHRLNRYRCFFPDLAGFAAAYCTEPGTWQTTILSWRPQGGPKRLLHAL